MGYKIGMPCMKLNNAGNKSKHSGSFGGVSMEALEERKGRDPDINPSLSYLNQTFGFSTARQLLAYSDHHVKKMNETLHEEGKRGIRKDAVRMIVTIFKPPADLMLELSNEEQTELLTDCLNEFSDLVGSDRIKAASMHFDERSPHVHVFWEPMTEDGRLCAKDVLNLKMYNTINHEMPKRLRKLGWDMIDDCQCYDADKETQLTAKEREQAYKERTAKNGRTSAQYKAQASKELLEAKRELEILMEDKMQILNSPEVKDQMYQTMHRGVIAKTKEFLLNHILPKLTTLIMFDIIEATLDFLDKKGFIKNKHEAVDELYGCGKSGVDMIAEDVRSRFNNSIEREIRCGMIEEPEYEVPSLRRGRHR